MLALGPYLALVERHVDYRFYLAGSGEGILAMTTVMFVSLIPFFAYAELGRVIGIGALHRLLIRREPVAPILVRDVIQ